MRHFSITVDYLENTSILFITDQEHTEKLPCGASFRPTKKYTKISTPGDAATAVKDFLMGISDGEGSM